MANRLLIVTTNQFGYHVDAYYYCKFLSGHYDITYICWDYGRPRITLEGVKVQYFSRAGAKPLRYLRWLVAAVAESVKRYDVVFVKYFPGCSAVRLARMHRLTICDVRTGSVSTRSRSRRIYDTTLKWECRVFQHLTIISESLRARLGLSVTDAHILPLGAEPLAQGEKSFETINMLYVGALEGRRIDDTIRGLRHYLDKHPVAAFCSYTIVGGGPNQEEERLRRLAKDLGLQDIVHVVGAVPHDRLASIFFLPNVGVSYVPITEYFDCQPPTKTFEYIVSGMAVIATATSENARVINSANGVLIPDTPQGFAEGIRELVENRPMLSSASIRSNAEEFRWRSIVEGNLRPYLVGIRTGMSGYFRPRPEL